MNTALNALVFLCVILEPFIPSFSAKVYEQMAIKRELKHETLIEAVLKDNKAILSLVSGGHVIGNPEPIFREIKEAEAEVWRKKFGGDK